LECASPLALLDGTANDAKYANGIRKRILSCVWYISRLLFPPGCPVHFGVDDAGVVAFKSQLCEGKAMNLKILIPLIAVATMLGWQAGAQTNIAPVILTNLNEAPYNLRDVNGQIYDITHSELWGPVTEKERLGWAGTDLDGNTVRNYISVHQIKGTTVLCDIFRSLSYPEKYSGILQENSKEYVRSIIILNYPKPESLVSGGGVDCVCMRTTNYVNSDGISFLTYDCGTKPTQDEIGKWRDEEAERQKAVKKELAEQRRVAAEKATAAKKAAQAKVVKWNQEQADKGDATGLLRMGELYRDGNGVPQDLNKAREYLTKAANAGSPGAADELSKLNQVSTNSPATR
jgi:predicted Fe-S protein YdhL (DUF1289 family)